MQTKPSQGSNGREMVPPAPSSHAVFGSSFAATPTLEEMLTPKYRDGKLIWEPISLKIQPMGTYFRVTLHMPTLRQEVSLLVLDLRTACDEIERQISSGKLVLMPDWESREKARQSRNR